MSDRHNEIMGYLQGLAINSPIVARKIKSYIAHLRGRISELEYPGQSVKIECRASDIEPAEAEVTELPFGEGKVFNLPRWELRLIDNTRQQGMSTYLQPEEMGELLKNKNHASALVHAMVDGVLSGVLDGPPDVTLGANDFKETTGENNDTEDA